MTPETRKRLFESAFTKAMLSLPLEKIQKAMAATGWQWFNSRTNSYYDVSVHELMDTIDRMRAIYFAIDYSETIQCACAFSGGFWIIADEEEYIDAGGEKLSIVNVNLLFSFSGEGSEEAR